MNTLPVFQGGDAIKISVFPDTNAFPGGIYEIDSDGYVDLPLVGFLQVTGLSGRTLEQLLKEKYVKFLPQPNLTVRPLVRIGLLGGFNRPGLYWIDARESIWAAVRSAGGTQREDGIVKIRWVRDSGIVAKNISGHFQAGKSLYAMGFKSGDQLCVTPRPRETVWERFRSNILPIASIVLSTAVSAAMAYITYDMSQQRQ
jgi:polysaccharide export outer membrane protein